MVIVQIGHNCLDQIRHIGEGAATNTLGGNLPEPTLHEVQPGTGSGGKVQLESGMPLDPGFHPRMLVGAVIVHDQMEIEPRWRLSIDLLQETDKLLMSMAGPTVSDHLAVQQVEGCEPGGSAVALVIVSEGAATALLEGQARLGAVKSLDLTLLIHAQHQRLVRRIEIEPDDVGQLLDQVLVAAELEGLEPRWFKAVLLPDALRRGLAQPLSAVHAAGAPVSCLGRGSVQGRLHHGAYFLRRYGRLASRTGSILFKSGQSQGQKTLSPELDRRPRHSQNLGNVLIRNPIGSQGNDLGPHHLAIRQVPASHPGFQGLAFLHSQDDGFSSSAHVQQHSRTNKFCKAIYDSRHYGLKVA